MMWSFEKSSPPDRFFYLQFPEKSIAVRLAGAGEIVAALRVRGVPVEDFWTAACRRCGALDCRQSKCVT